MDNDDIIKGRVVFDPHLYKNGDAYGKGHGRFPSVKEFKRLIAQELAGLERDMVAYYKKWKDLPKKNSSVTKASSSKKS